MTTMDDHYEQLFRKLNPPRVVIDNESCKNATIVRVDSASVFGILLDVVQVLADLNLIITKAYISSDGGWFMDVFNVTDHEGNKVVDSMILDFIRNSVASEKPQSKSGNDTTLIEMIGNDRPGLLSEMTAILASLSCDVRGADLWTHNERAAAVIEITDAATSAAIEGHERLAKIKERLHHLLTGGNMTKEAMVSVSGEAEHADRKLHRLMFSERDYDGNSMSEKVKPSVSIENWDEKEYSVIAVATKDRPKLLFDTLCALSDLNYVVSHANVDTDGPLARHEYYVRHADGYSIKSEAERQRVIRCVKAAISRRASEGLKLELCTTDRVGLLSDVTRIFRESSLTVVRAEVRTSGGKARNTFYVENVSGYPVDAKIIESIRQSIGDTILKVNGGVEDAPTQESGFFGGLFRTKSFVNFRLIRSYS